MLRFIFVISIFLFETNFISAQDTLYKTNHEKEIVKVQQVGPTEIIYKRYSSPEGPLYVISTSSVSKIVYMDGHVEIFQEADVISNDNTAEKFPFHHWTVGYNAFDIMFSVISVSCEYTCKKNDLSFRVPISFGAAALAGNKPPTYYRPEYYYYNKDKLLSTGIDLRLFPNHKTHIANYYLGVSVEYGMVNYMGFRYYDNYNQGYGGVVTKITSYLGVGVTNGVLLMPTKNFSIGIDFTGGMMVTGLESDNSNKQMGRFGINMGYRFG